MTDADDNHYWSMIEHAHETVSIYDGPGVFLEQFGQLQPHVRHLLAAHWFHSEFSNGGLHQFFYNPTGVLAPEAVAGLTAIGLEPVAKILCEAMARIDPSYPRDRDARMNIVGRNPLIGMDFDDLDEKLGVAFGELIKNGDDVWLDGFDRAADEYARQQSRNRR